MGAAAKYVAAALAILHAIKTGQKAGNCFHYWLVADFF
jgi:hypothetical protein